MSDDLDDLLRRTMKSLDDQVPAGYFEDLPNRTLARLGDDSMQSPSDSDQEPDSTGAPPAKDRDEDSGLHDIRSLASSQRMRLSSKKSTQNPALSDDDILASSSAGWKAVALPEPAKMVSLPELADLPAQREAAERDKTAKKFEKSERSSKDKIERSSKEKIERSSKEKIEAAATAAAVEAPAAAPPAAEARASTPAVTPITARPKPAPRPAGGGRNVLYAITGLSVAAAAGAAIFLTTRKDAGAPDTSSSFEVTASEPKAVSAPAAMPTAQIAADPADAGVAAEAIAAGSAAAIESPSLPGEGLTTGEGKPADPAKGKVPDKPGKQTNDEPAMGKLKPAAPVSGEGKKGQAKTAPDGEPSFDELLKEAGVEGKKEVKPKLDKKSLSRDDIQNGMGGVATQAQGCYDGTQGTATVKLTVAPDGRVQKAVVTGQFAGTKEGNCVEAAVKAATFPPWDGGPQSFGYSYLLSE